jgi:hypothetical protein
MEFVQWRVQWECRSTIDKMLKGYGTRVNSIIEKKALELKGFISSPDFNHIGTTDGKPELAPALICALLTRTYEDTPDWYKETIFQTLEAGTKILSSGCKL